MKFFALLILPAHTELTDPQRLIQTIAELMRPFDLSNEDLPVAQGRWDDYICCTRDWMEESGYGYAYYGTIMADQP